ncbi:hypothetical protein ACH5RR_027080 [Cinchona calisaya]|uniref:Uncharacterized protein n=1 Tax=Cinchona calisaya TaxID=153742 RepID=A0ABD2Z4F8_9GENT
MNNNKVHSQGTVPFSWENKPGLRKYSKDDHYHGDFPIIKLPPSPCPPENSRASFHHNMQIPPPPCLNFQHQQRRSSRRSSKKKYDDPFLIAYKECTKTTRKDDHKWSSGVISRVDGVFGLKNNLSIFSCKHSNNVIDDSIFRVSQLPISKSQRES